jgi:glycosyltransferase 2 family protein
MRREAGRQLKGASTSSTKVSFLIILPSRSAPPTLSEAEGARGHLELLPFFGCPTGLPAPSLEECRTWVLGFSFPGPAITPIRPERRTPTFTLPLFYSFTSPALRPFYLPRGELLPAFHPKHCIFPEFWLRSLHMPVRSRKWWLVGFGVLVLAFLLYRSRGVLHLSQFSGAKLWDVLRGANYLYLFLAVVTIYACYAIRALRWQKFQAHVGQAKFWNIYSMNLAGFSALFLIGRAAEPVRPLLISRKDNIPIADTFGIYALERILDAASTAVLASVGLLVFESSGHAATEGAGLAFEKAARTAGIAFSIFAIIAISALVFLRLHGSAVLERRMQHWLADHGWRAKVARILLGFARGVQTVRTWGDVFAAIFLSLLHWLLVVFCYFLVIRSFSGRLATLTFSDAMLVLVFTMVGSAVQLPGVGGGAQALSIVAFTHLYGVEQEPAVAAAMMLWLITFAACTIAGVPLLLKEGLSLGELRRMRKHEVEQIDAEMAEHPSPPLS